MSGPMGRPGSTSGAAMGGGTAAGGRPGGPAAGPGGGRGPGGGGPMHMGMNMGGAKSKNFGPSFRRLVGELRPESPKIALVILLAVISVTLSVIGPKIMGWAFDAVTSGFIGKVIGQNAPQLVGTSHDQLVAALQADGSPFAAQITAYPNIQAGVGIDFGKLGAILGGLVLIYVISAVFSWGQAYIMAGVTQRTVYGLRLQVSEKLGRLPLSYYDRESRGDILSRVTNDIDNISQTLQQSLTQLITSVLTVVGMLIMMLTISWELAAISLLVLPVSIVLTMVIAKRSQVQFAAQWERVGSLNGHVEEMHTGHTIVKLFGRQEEAVEVFDQRNESLYDASWRAQFISGLIQPTMQFVSNLNYVAIAVIGGIRVANGQMTLGDVTAFIQYSRQFTFPIIQAASIANVLQSAVASAERVFELLDEEEEIPDPAQPVLLKEPAEGRVTFEDVSFRYLPDKPLIEDLDLAVEPGQTVAIVGPTGAGKTTLVNLLMRFYDVDHGRITVDGLDTRTLTRDNLRRTFGMVLQDTWLFKGTVRENVTYGADGDVPEERFHAAVEAAHVDHFVRTLPDGYDTVLDDDATNTSAGEKQLLTIARAFLADPPVLILDEATSSVDTRTEVLIQRAMARLMEGRTSFVIAHRLSTIRDADVILVMREGRIVEKGTHQELLAQRGFYHELYASQFEEALDPVA
jgi:ATP-binding cassette, subfamily B, multidrug efflux pump